MVWKCSVPNCDGNDKNGPKMMVFSFPSNLNFKATMVSSHKKECFVSTISSRVCELPFHKEDIEKVTTCCVECTGEILTTKLKHPRLGQGAVLSLSPGCSTYLSKSERSHRELPISKETKNGTSKVLKLQKPFLQPDHFHL